MIMACLDLEGVLFPEIWINVANKTEIPELRLTTRDISDYDKLMQHRLKILKEKKIAIQEIKNIINTLKPLPGAKAFFKRLKEKYQIIILSDTFYQFAMPLMKQLDYPTIFCHSLVINNYGYITNYKLRMKDSKKNSIIKLRELKFNTIACGDSYNDIAMLESADKGILFRPPENFVEDYSKFPIAMDYDSLWKEFITAENHLKSYSM